MHTAIAWFVRNPVAANLAMWVMIIAGILGLLVVNQEEFPNFDIQIVSVSVPYLGAAPVEVEEGVCIRVEEAIEGVEGIDKLHSASSEGHCSVTAELLLDADEVVVLNEIKSRVDGINSFPAETEKPIVAKATITRDVLQIAISGDTDERVLKELGKRIRDDIAAMPGVTQVGLTYVRPYEISIEVSENELRRLGITLDQVARAVRATSLDMPGGTIKTDGGEILIRTKGQAYRGEEFERIIIMTRADGTKVTLAELADVRDDFAEGELSARFNGMPGVIIQVMQVGRSPAAFFAHSPSAAPQAPRQATSPVASSGAAAATASTQLVRQVARSARHVRRVVRSSCRQSRRHEPRSPSPSRSLHSTRQAP
jgi:multidrug efflux pump subunit AcrB